MMPEKEKGCSWSRIFFVFFSMKNHNRLCVIGLFRDIFSGCKGIDFRCNLVAIVVVIGRNTYLCDFSLFPILGYLCDLTFSGKQAIIKN